MSQLFDQSEAGLLTHQHGLLHEWAVLIERGLDALNAGTLDELEAISIQEARLLDQWQLLRAAPAFGARQNAQDAPLDVAALREEVRAATRRVMNLNRQFALALQTRERFVTSRLSVLCAAAGMVGVYCGAGRMTPARPDRNTAIIA